MTWKEFKEAIEKEGVSDDDTIFRIETGSYPSTQNMRINVFHLPNGERDICIDVVREEVSFESGSIANVFKPAFGAAYESMSRRAGEYGSRVVEL